MQEAISTVRQRRPFTILGALIALVTVGAFLFLATRPATEGPLTVPGTSGPGLDVVVAKQDIKGRATIVAEMVQVVHMPASNAPPGHFEKATDLVGGKTEHFALIDIKAGQPVLVNEVVSSRAELTSAEPTYLPIPSGFVAMTIPTGEQQGVAGNIQPGDYIGIIAIVEGRSGTLAKTVFNNVRVIRVGTALDQAAAARGTSNPSHVTPAIGSSLTVVLTECDAEYLNWFLARTTLRYTLESYQDYGVGTANNPQKAEGCAIDRAAGISNADVARRFGPGIIPAGAVGS
ncbi:MAG: Flp pilus assembly protein CpaB [Candidatus Dormibacteraeota bacterium]|nr:Flp pilus assembly protein CpaB [Candidatus Dormibacteraeota bacterium]